MNHSSPCRATKRQQSSLKSAEGSEILSVRDLLSTSGSWSENYPVFLKHRASSGSPAMKSSCHEITRLAACRFVTSVPELLVLFSRFTWAVNETQEPACTWRHWQRPRSSAAAVLRSCFTRTSDTPCRTPCGSLPTAQGGCRLFAFTEAIILVNRQQCRSAPVMHTQVVRGQEPFIKVINFKRCQNVCKV